MIETRQSAQDAPAKGPQQEDETVPAPTDEAESTDEREDDSDAHSARRRATLSKEIRDGWRRALGH